MRGYICFGAPDAVEGISEGPREMIQANSTVRLCLTPDHSHVNGGLWQVTTGTGTSEVTNSYPARFNTDGTVTLSVVPRSGVTWDSERGTQIVSGTEHKLQSHVGYSIAHRPASTAALQREWIVLHDDRAFGQIVGPKGMGEGEPFGVEEEDTEEESTEEESTESE